MSCPPRRTLSLFAATLCLSAAAPPARADDESRLRAMENQIQALQIELRHMKQDAAVRHREIAAAQAQAAQAEKAAAHAAILAPPGYRLVAVSGGATLEAAASPEKPKLPLGTFRIGNVTVTLGGFLEGAGLYRSRNQAADIGSNFNTGIPLANSPNYHQGEFRFSARQSRFSTLVQAQADEVTKLTAFGEFDLLGAAPTANSVQSDSYTPRLRHAFAVYDRTDDDFYILGGQTWSLLTMSKKGIGYLSSSANLPAGIDLNYLPGFTWARQPQLRIAKSFDKGRFSLAASLENPQTTWYTGPNGLLPATDGSVNIVNPGGLGNAPTVNYSTDVAPDIVVKAAFDPSFGHFEAYGVASFIHDRVSTTGHGSNHTVMGGGGGAAALVHLVPKYLDLQGSFLAGAGVGRFSSTSLPDAIVGPDGQPEPLPEVQALIGIIGHPVPSVDLYSYIGTDQISRKYFSTTVGGKETGYGYGNPLYTQTSCGVELGAEASCVANTSGVTEITAGAWWRFLKGDYGTMQVGAQYAYAHRTVFDGQGPTPKTDENTVLVSFRYYPFQ